MKRPVCLALLALCSGSLSQAVAQAVAPMATGDAPAAAPATTEIRENTASADAHRLLSTLRIDRTGTPAKPAGPEILPLVRTSGTPEPVRTIAPVNDWLTTPPASTPRSV